MKLSAPKLELLPFHTVIEDAQARAEWDETSGSLVRAKLSASSIRYFESDSKTGELKGLSLSAELPLAFFPFSLGNRLGLKIQAGHLEALLDPYYVDTSLAEVPVTVETVLNQGRPTSTTIQLGQEKKGAALTLAPSFVDAVSMSLKNIRARLKIFRLPLAPFFKIAQGFPELASVIDLDLWSGRLDFDLEGGIPFGENGLPQPLLNARNMLNPWVEAWKGRLRLENVSVLWKRMAFLFRGLSLEFPFRLKEGGDKGTLEVDRIAFRKWEGSLPRLPWSLARNREAAREVLKLELPEGLVLESPLKLSPQVTETIVKFRPGEEDLFEAKTGVELAKTPLEPWLRALCIPLNPVPPAEIEISLPRIVFFPDAVEPRGSLRLTAFGGELEVSDIGAYEWLSGMPEVDFSVRFGGFDLGKLGPWLGFGKMVGTIEGYANNVTTVGPVPTHYDFRIELKPPRGGQVVFSPQAMRNVVSLIAGPETLKDVPSAGQWFFFGLPRELLGGYGVKYAGFTAFSTEGSILLETLDPPGSKEHFILRSASSIFDVDTFTVRIASRTYPVLLDAESMRSRVLNVISVIDDLAKTKNAEAAAARKPEPEGAQLGTCLPREFDEPPKLKAD